MLSKKSRPMIGILTGSFLSGNKSGLVDFATSPRTPKGVRKSFETCGIGLGIVAALENPADARSESPAVISRNSATSPRRNPESDEEDYTIVIRHLTKKAHTRVYGERIQTQTKKQTSMFQISPEPVDCGIPGADFLSSCHLCRKKLEGKDIFMYRGEKAFCSTECRYREMAVEERREKRGSIVDVSSPACVGNGPIISTGILAI